LEYFRESLENAYSDARRSILGGLLVCFADERMFEERMKSLGITGVSSAKITEDFCDVFIKCFEKGIKDEVVNIVIDCNKEQNARLDGFGVIDEILNDKRRKDAAVSVAKKVAFLIGGQLPALGNIIEGVKDIYEFVEREDEARNEELEVLNFCKDIMNSLVEVSKERVILIYVKDIHKADNITLMILNYLLRRLDKGFFVLVSGDIDNNRLTRKMKQFCCRYNHYEDPFSDTPNRRIPEGIFVGREDEVKILKEVYLRFKNDNKPYFMLITGEAGDGKSALVEYFLDRDNGFVVDEDRIGVATCEPRGSGLYGEMSVIGELLEDVVYRRGKRVDDIAKIVFKGLKYTPVVGRFFQIFENISEIAVELAKIKAIYSEEGSTQKRIEDSLRKLTNKTDAKELNNRIINTICDIAEDASLILFVDDIQWMDSTSAEILYELVLNRLNKSGIRVMIIFSYRLSELNQQKGKEGIQGYDIVEYIRENFRDSLCEINLSERRFGIEGIRRYIDKALSPNEIGDDFAGKIYRITQGTPFFVTEVINLLVDRSEIVKEDCWRLKKDLREIEIPKNVDEVIDERIDLLKGQSKRLIYEACRHSALFGMKFKDVFVENYFKRVIENGLLEDLRDEIKAGDIKNEIKTLRDVYQILVNTEPDEIMKMVEGNDYGFSHIRLYEKVYRLFNEEEKRVLFRLIGETIEELYKGREYLVSDRLYKYFREAVDYIKAVKYGVDIAADYFQKRRYKEALDLLNDLEEFCKEGLEVKYSEELETGLSDIYMYKGFALTQLGRFDEALEYYDKAIKVFNSLSEDGDEESRGNIIKAYIHKGITLSESRKFYESLESYDKGISEAMDLINNAGRSELKSNLATLYINKGDALRSLKRFSESIEITDRAIEILENLISVEKRKELKDHLALSYMNKAIGFCNIGEIEKSIGFYDESIRIYIELIENEGRSELRAELAMCFINKANALSELRLFKDGLDLYDKAIDIYEKLIEKEGRVELRTNLAWSYVLKGRLLSSLEETEEALKFYEKGIMIYEDLIENEGRRDLREELALSMIDMGDAFDSKENYEKAIELFDRSIDIFKELIEKEGRRDLLDNLANIYCHKMRTMGTVGRFDEAIELVNTSTRLYEELIIIEGRRDLQGELARSYALKGILLRLREDFESAIESFDRAVEIFQKTEGVDSYLSELVSIYIEKALTFAYSNNLDGAITCLDYGSKVLRDIETKEAVRIPTAEISIMKGFIFEGMGRVDAALEAIDYGIKKYQELILENKYELVAYDIEEVYEKCRKWMEDTMNRCYKSDKKVREFIERLRRGRV
jgi:tetratricopeptide (TPR) repeat protein